MKIMNNYTLNDLRSMVKPYEIGGFHIPSGEVTPDYELFDDDLLMTLCFIALKPANSSQSETYDYQRIMGLLELTPWELFITKKVFSGSTKSVNITPYTKLFRLINMRFGDHYCVSSEEYLEVSNISFSHDFNGNKDVYKFAELFLGVLMSTRDKYVTLLEAYQDNIDKLMQPLTSKVKAKNLFNDTPQTTDVVTAMEGNQYVTNLSKNEAESESDNAYIIEKLKKIQDDYENVLFRWSQEFDRLFIEEHMI